MVCDGANEWTQGSTGDSIIPNRSIMTPAPDPASPRAAARPTSQQQQQQPLKCPRCDSANTKFCYYNNYSLSQPRHFCKACKRYWTRGGTLRNVPVGGGCRKNKRVIKKAPSAAAAATTSSSTDHLNNSIFFGQTSLPTLPPMYDLHQPPPQVSALGIAHDMERFQLGFGGGVADLQQSGGFLSAYPMPSFDQDVKVEGENNVAGILDWQAQAQAQDPHEMMMYWSSAPMPDISSFSLAPLM